VTQDGDDLLELEELWAVDGKKLKYKLKPLSGCKWTSWGSGQQMPAGNDGAFVAEWHSVELVNTCAFYTALRLIKALAT
jgi:hypothetical protein